MQELVDFLGPVRKDLVVALKERGTATAAELASATFLSIAATRAHLLVLERAGVITYERLRQGVGRPAHRYRLSERGEALFPQGYAAFSKSLMAIALRHDECREVLLESMADMQLARLGADVTAPLPGKRAEQLAEGMRRQGFSVQVEQRKGNAWEMRMGHCPLLQVAREFPAICEIEQRALAECAGPNVNVEYLSRQADGGSKCIAVLTWPADAEVAAS